MVCGNYPSPQAWLIHQGKSLHLQHGPIDLIITASGSRNAIRYAYQQAHCAFQDVLSGLVDELRELRTPVSRLVQLDYKPDGPVAKRMVAVCLPFGPRYVTPMAAVAGAVADHVLSAVMINSSVTKLLINNGGDIAIELRQGQSCRIGICGQPARAQYDAVVTLQAEDGIGGVATSGWQGRSQSLGVADAVTVLADNAAMADVAATLIANDVDIPHSKSIYRAAANDLDADSDLGRQAVTIAVDTLSPTEIDFALQRGITCANRMLECELIRCAYIHLQGVTEIVTTSAKQACTVDGGFGLFALNG